MLFRRDSRLWKRLNSICTDLKKRKNHHLVQNNLISVLALVREGSDTNEIHHCNDVHDHGKWFCGMCQRHSGTSLIDGRVYKPKAVHHDGDRLQFTAKGREYNLPSLLLDTGQDRDSVKVLRVEVSRGAIVSPDGNLNGFQELIRYLNKNATRSTPVILVMNDVVSWPDGLRQNFGRAVKKVRKRAYIGIEGPLPEK